MENYSNVRIGGEIFEKSNTVTDIELIRVSEIELELKKTLDIKSKAKYFDCDNENNYPIITHEKNNEYWCFECFPKYCFEFTQDISFSHAYFLLEKEDKDIVNEIFIDAAIEVFENNIKQKLTGLYGYYIILENKKYDKPYLNLKFYLSSFEIKNKQTRLSKLDYDEYHEPQFLDMLSAIYKSIIIPKWNKLFLQLPIEGYDKNGKAVLRKNQEIYNWRVAFTDDILKKIRNNYDELEDLDGSVILSEYSVKKIN